MDIKGLFMAAALGASASTAVFAEQVSLPSSVTTNVKEQHHAFFDSSKKVQEKLMAEESKSDGESRVVKKNYENYISALAGLDHANHRYVNREYYQNKATMRALEAKIDEVQSQLAFIEKTIQVKGEFPALVDEKRKKVGELGAYQKHLRSVERSLRSNAIESK